jgi:uncharacterized protein with HEPN domain
MNKDKQRLADYLAHMLQAIERITRYRESQVARARGFPARVAAG